MKTATLLLQQLRDLATTATERSKKADPKMWVSARDVEQLCVHAEQAMVGEYMDADYAIQTLLEDKRKLMAQMDRIAELHDPDSETWKLAMDHGIF